MSILALDLSTKNSGWSIFSKDGKLLDTGAITPDEHIEPCFKINFLTNKIKDLFHRAEACFIEGLYYNPYGGSGFDDIILLAHLAGAVSNEWINYKHNKPYIIKATEARKANGIKGYAHKSEIQVWVLRKYNFADKKKVTEYEQQIAEHKAAFPTTFKRGITEAQKKVNKSNRGKLKRRLNKLSIEIKKETGIGEDIADAIIIGLAGVKKLNAKKS